MFETENVDSLASCMEKFKDERFYEACRENVAKYNYGGAMNDYSEKAMSIIQNVLKK